MKTPLLKLSILFACVSSLAGCQTNAPPSCAGWQKIDVLAPTAVYLAGNDLKAGQSIASHNKHGQNTGCWK